MFKSKERKKFEKYKKLIEKSGLFDSKFYLKTYRDARVASETPIDHFIKIGLKEDRKPNEWFDPIWYKQYYIDVKEDGVYPFIHYIRFGKQENRHPNADLCSKTEVLFEKIKPIFNEQGYLQANKDVQKAVENKAYASAFEHFKVTGYMQVFEGQRRLGNEFPFFTLEDYRTVNEDLREVDALEHFFQHGYKEYTQGLRILGGYYPFELTESLEKLLRDNFDEKSYIEASLDLQLALEQKLIKSGWEHFKKYGINEIREGKRKIHKDIPLMSEHEYVKYNRDIFDALKRGDISSPYEHFLVYGVKEYLDGSRKLPYSHMSVYQYYEPTLTEEIRQEISSFQHKPLISIVMPVYNVDPKWLDLAIKSIENQWYDNWEICIADDASTRSETIAYLKALSHPKIKIVFLEKNVNISGASNATLTLANGEYIALMDNDDELTPDALYEVVKVINEEGAEFIYSDEDKLEMDGSFSEPHFKPDFASDMFLSQNYLSHLGVIKRELIEQVGGWEVGLEGSQDYDLYLKVLELTDKIVHIPKVLYHWRKIPGSTAAEYGEKSYAQEAGRKALENAMKRRKIDATVKNGLTAGTYKVEYHLKDTPLVSIIIPFKDKPELLKMSIESLLNKSTYQNYEIIGVSNNSKEKATFDEMKRLEALDGRVRFYEYNEPFNYSAINNYAVNNFTQGEHIVLMNNDIEIITPNWIEELLMHSQREEIGVVGAKLYYPDDTIQHAGLVCAPKTAHGIITVFSKWKGDSYGYFSRLKCINNYNAVTAALLMIKKDLFLDVDGFDEKNLKIAYNDVDLCLKVRELDYLNVWTPFCESYHHESVSRGYETSLMDIERLRKEQENLKYKHKSYFNNYDKYYNLNLIDFAGGFEVSPIHTYKRDKFLPNTFKENILCSYEFSKKEKNKVAIFVHYDKDNVIDDYVLYYLQELSKDFDILFVSTASGLQDNEIQKISDYCMHALVKENYGYDFGAWKSGLNFLESKLNTYEGLLLCNDSIYGPLCNLNQVYQKMENFDIWSLTDSFEIAHHLQSYFVYYNTKAFKSITFKNFWDNFQIFEDKFTLINECEIGYSEALLQDSTLKVGVYYPSKNITNLNITHYYWKKLVKEHFPFVKIELLKVNPLGLDISDWKKTIVDSSSYPVSLIEKHLERVQ